MRKMGSMIMMTTTMIVEGGRPDFEASDEKIFRKHDRIPRRSLEKRL
jgi:hypothetical protein